MRKIDGWEEWMRGWMARGERHGETRWEEKERAKS